MSENHETNPQANNEESNEIEDAPAKTPLEQVKENQAMMQENLEVTQQHIDTSPEVPGASIPSDKRHHPQRQNNYEGGENNPNYARLR